MPDVIPIGPLRPYVCTYRRGGRPFGITLWATGEEIIMSAWRRHLLELTVDGALIAVRPYLNGLVSADHRGHAASAKVCGCCIPPKAHG